MRTALSDFIVRRDRKATAPSPSGSVLERLISRRPVPSGWASISLPLDRRRFGHAQHGVPHQADHGNVSLSPALCGSPPLQIAAPPPSRSARRRTYRRQHVHCERLCLPLQFAVPSGCVLQRAPDTRVVAGIDQPGGPVHERDGGDRRVQRGRFVAKFLVAFRDVCGNLCGVSRQRGDACFLSPIGKESPLAAVVPARIFGQFVFEISASASIFSSD